MLAIALIILLFASLVIIHEWGHFIAARRNGVEVEEFGFGFPPRLFGIKRKETLYSINLLPLGGFVRLKGEDAADAGPGTFGGASMWAKTKILLAGIVMNLVTAVVILYALCVTGLPGLGPGFEPGFLKPDYAQPRQLLLVDVSPNSPAAEAGLRRGDFVLEANGQSLTTDEELRNFTRAHAGEAVTFKVRHDGQVRDVEAKLRDPNSKEGFLGVGSQEVYRLRYDPLSAVVASLYITGALLVATIVGVGQLFLHIPTLIAGLFTGGVPQAAQAASGPLGIVVILKNIASFGWDYVLLFTANISVALAAFNVLPLPALDGGRLFILWLQHLTGRRWSAETEARYHAIGFMALIGLMILISIYDLRKFF